MNEIVYQGERIIWGQIGQSAIYSAFITAFIAMIFFFLAEKNPLQTFWQKLAKFIFVFHSVSVLTILSVLYYIIYNHYFEYQYVWQHSSTDLPWYYMISCFWEGQEGSFLLWIFWQMVIGFFILKYTKNWSSPIMSILMISQLALMSMLLGITVFAHNIGISPFELLRNAMPNEDIFKNANYLTLIKDGNGLNPLLQNYWMVIHPPILFLGFALTIVPFAFAISSLWRKDYTNWLKFVQPWLLIGTMVLGAGIIMGGFWAYESLNFGGYWAWDPVENASLVPWLLMIAAVHVVIVSNATGRSLKFSYFLIFSAFLSVLYATFLTRSGVLGNASVHSFTDLGMSGQLLVFMFIFVVLSAIIFAFHFRKFPKVESDESIFSREFWMVIGGIMLFFSAFQVTLTTSIPVLNKIFGSNLAPPSDIIGHYNKWQMPIAIIIGILIGVGGFLKFRQNSPTVLKRLLVWAAISVALSVLLMFGFGLNNWFFFGLLFAGVFAIVGNVVLFKPYVIGEKKKLPGSLVAHIGFGILLIGVLVSSANKKVISINQSGHDLSTEFSGKENTENVLLELNKPIRMGEYEITYQGDSIHWVNTYYKIHYTKLKKESNASDYEFFLYPNAQINPKMGLIANPDTKHYLSHDVFTFVSSVPNKESNLKFLEEKKQQIKMHDTLQFNGGFAVLTGVNSNFDENTLDLNSSKLYIKAELLLYSNGKTFTASPVYFINKNSVIINDTYVDELNLRLRFTSIDTDKGELTIETAVRDTSEDFVIMKAIKFPWINLVWAGTIIMIIGMFFSIINRFRKLNKALKP